MTRKRVLADDLAELLNPAPARGKGCLYGRAASLAGRGANLQPVCPAAVAQLAQHSTPHTAAGPSPGRPGPCACRYVPMLGAQSTTPMPSSLAMACSYPAAMTSWTHRPLYCRAGQGGQGGAADVQLRGRCTGGRAWGGEEGGGGGTRIRGVWPPKACCACPHLAGTPNTHPWTGSLPRRPGCARALSSMTTCTGARRRRVPPCSGTKKVPTGGEGERGQRAHCDVKSSLLPLGFWQHRTALGQAAIGGQGRGLGEGGRAHGSCVACTQAQALGTTIAPRAGALAHSRGCAAVPPPFPPLPPTPHPSHPSHPTPHPNPHKHNPRRNPDPPVRTRPRSAPTPHPVRRGRRFGRQQRRGRGGG